MSETNWTDFDAVMVAEGVEPADDETRIAAFQHLINTGLVWRLQGWFGRTAAALIENGLCTPTPATADGLIL